MNYLSDDDDDINQNAQRVTQDFMNPQELQAHYNAMIDTQQDQQTQMQQQYQQQPQQQAQQLDDDSKVEAIINTAAQALIGIDPQLTGIGDAMKYCVTYVINMAGLLLNSMIPMDSRQLYTDMIKTAKDHGTLRMLSDILDEYRKDEGAMVFNKDIVRTSVFDPESDANIPFVTLLLDAPANVVEQASRIIEQNKF